MRGESGEDLGRTWGDVGLEVAQAIAHLGNSATVRKVEGEDWSAYKVGTNVIRIDVKVNAQ